MGRSAEEVASAQFEETPRGRGAQDAVPQSADERGQQRPGAPGEAGALREQQRSRSAAQL